MIRLLKIEDKDCGFSYSKAPSLMVCLEAISDPQSDNLIMPIECQTMSAAENVICSGSCHSRGGGEGGCIILLD